MKRKERVSKSTYRAILYVQKDRDESSGLLVTDRFFRPGQEPRSRRLLWLCVDAALLSCLVVGLLLLLTTGFSAAVAPWFYPAVLLLCVGLTLTFRSRLCARYWPAVAILFLLAYLTVLFLNQDAFLSGMRQFGSLIQYTIQSTYAADEELLFPGSGAQVQIFLLFCAVPLTVWLAMSLFFSNVFLMAYLLIFPLLALLALCGAVHNTAALFLILFGVVIGTAFSQPKKQHRMWGGKNEMLYTQNKLRFEAVQKKTVLAVLAACIVVSVPGFLVVRPLLSVSLKPAEQFSMQLQSNFLNRVMKLLPELTAGQWNLNLEAIGGGVQDGALSSDEGYLLEGVEDLRLTLNCKPQQALFLKGFVGKNYENGTWVAGAGATFDGAAMNWNTEGAARMYIQNLPFLRTAYVLSGGAAEDEELMARIAQISADPVQLWVERLNANDSYTYVPYGAYLNDYYQVESGDCAVSGQKEQEDRYYFFPRDDMESVLTVWNTLDDTANVLDRVEESYRAFCQTDCSAIPDWMEPFQEEVQSVMRENKWKPTENVAEITSWIRQHLAKEYDYQLFPPDTPDGTDDLQFFLFESKQGNSVHFASAAVMFYRMFGIPARYVVGYEIPAAMFTVQSNGIYTATVQGDNSQAWAEIYVPGIGWSPRDMTPGVIGTFEEVGPGGEKIEAVIEMETEPIEETQPTVPEETLPEEQPETDNMEPDHTALTLPQIIGLFFGLILLCLLLTGLAAWYSAISKAHGWKTITRRSTNTRLLGVFQVFFRRMQRLGLPKNVNSQSETFTIFCEEQLVLRDAEAAHNLRPALQHLYACCFGGETAEESDIRRMRLILTASRKRRMKKQKDSGGIKK